ncbi:hypothetical protein TG4357_01966 [Thalassovita gelatinovora]|uniref:DUF1127 domain-containing protein n=1 Tax=Thalassovita gelatinovora TaxID=53501 RepID=A0A0P1FC25_THAGE|nr:hypothetical protein [Thalassovita gelatinovora]QIZ79978.1 hypothetical protein HFZ77_05505 [Thalassovita gelatinovora]CUH65629.1 hypothetical protein TG4357_01966 [Thalassovita gelatinovora]SER05967.1 hypothetical protein SAMN04488043_11488 [Thalassovita gelatinovora]
MATQATNLPVEKSGLRVRFDDFMAGIATGMNAYMEQKSRSAEIEALNAKTDAELAAMGLKRENIAYYVFRDMFYV